MRTINHLFVMLMLLINVSIVFAQESQSVAATDGGWNADGTLIALGYDNGVIQILDGLTYQPVTSFQLANQVLTLEWHPSNPDLLAVTELNLSRLSPPNSSLYIISLRDRSFDAILQNHQLIRDFDWALDGTYILLGTSVIGNSYTEYPWLELWSVNTKSMIYSNPGGITDLDVSPDGQFVVLAYPDTDYIAAILHVDPYEGRFGLRGHTAIIGHLAWSPDITMVATAGGYGDQTIRVWDTDSGETLRTFTDVYATDLVWCPDNTCIATASTSVQLLQVDTGEILNLGTFDNAPSTIDLSPYGGRLLFAGNSNMQRIGVRDETEQLNSGLHIIVPDPSLDRLNAIAELCVRDAATQSLAVTGLTSQRVDSLDALPNFVAQVESLPEGAIPAACRADLLAVAGALR